MFDRYRSAYPQLITEWQQLVEGELPAEWASHLPSFPADPKGIASRAASGQTLNALAAALPALIGGSADLAGSNNTLIKNSATISATDFSGRNFYFGVREHAMGAALNGMSLHSRLIPYGGTFLVFSDYLRPAIRLAALMKQQVIYVFTHDSIGLGEDGPTHQPVEHLAALRAIPNLFVIRPGDANETAQAWRVAIERRDGPTALVLSRQALPTLDRTALAPAEGTLRGAYLLRESANPQALLIASGSEVSLALAAADHLASSGIAANVISMPCQELFAQQPQSYRDQVLPPALRARVAIEAGRSFGWDRYVGLDGRTITVDQFGASAPAATIFREYGLTVERIAASVRELL